MVATLTRRPSYPLPDWRLVGPWYRWTQPGHPQAGRLSRPAIQKFAGDDFIDAFLERPQHSLKYDTTVDVVNNYDLAQATVAGALAGKFSTLFKVNSKGQPASDTDTPFRARLAPSDLRKLYQPAHDRHYLVTCQLHCDEVGFPRVGRAQVCQSGFVLRRRLTTPKSTLTKAIAKDIADETAQLRRLEADMADLRHLEETLSAPNISDKLQQATEARQQALADEAGEADWDALMARRLAELEAARTALHQRYADYYDVTVLGWFPERSGGRPSRMYGQWQKLGDAEQHADPADSGETTYRLFPLVPDPTEADHDARGRTFYYGTVPTAGVEHDRNGVARFDDQSTYELVCFTRQHQADPGRPSKQPDCCGPVIWSRPTEPFRVAGAADPLGTANRPISIKMPDLRDLAAHAARRPRGKLSPVRFIQPQHLSPKGGSMEEGSMGGEAICSFSIPLITIIALFVLNLFLPIVVLIFNLWFLLVFRFCIPPSIGISADVDAALAITPPGIDLDADFAVSVGGSALSASDLNTSLNASVPPRIFEDTGRGITPDLGDFSNAALGPLDQSLSDNADLTADADGNLPPPPPVGSPLDYEDPVTPVWPAAGGAA